MFERLDLGDRLGSHPKDPGGGTNFGIRQVPERPGFTIPVQGQHSRPCPQGETVLPLTKSSSRGTYPRSWTGPFGGITLYPLLGVAKPALNLLEPLGLEDEPGIEVPLLGYVSAGRPVETPEEQETIRVPSHMTRKASYALRVRGHSMIDDQIQDGDIIVIEQRQTAENGETVVALINGQQVTLKKFYVEARGVRLQPANPEMAPLYLRHDEIEILGIVSGVVRMTA